MSTKRQVRCAIYTRKSSEEGLEQDFNSLDAQREACEAYVVSQKAEGWIALRDHFDDGGFSGGTLERPALRRLMKEIEAGKVDVIVVYKIDRLSRSLMDFAKLVEAFDRKCVTFVSVTQSFNTTNSMGRLTLNVLLLATLTANEIKGACVLPTRPRPASRSQTPDTYQRRPLSKTPSLAKRSRSIHLGGKRTFVCFVVRFPTFGGHEFRAVKNDCGGNGPKPGLPTYLLGRPL